MKKTITCTFIMTILLFVFGCSQAKLRSGNEAQKQLPLPPYSLIQSNYEQSSLTVLLKVTSNKIEKTIFADDGSPGYIITRESGTVLHTFKGDLKAGEKIIFHDWLEYNTHWKKERAESLLVFLKKKDNAQTYKTIGEAAVFSYNRGLLNMLNDIIGKK